MPLRHRDDEVGGLDDADPVALHIAHEQMLLALARKCADGGDHGVVATRLSSHRVYTEADAHALSVRLLRAGVDPRWREELADVEQRLLLVHRQPACAVELGSLHVAVGEPLGSQTLSWRAPNRVINLGLHRR